jgi:hypothetical protein
MLCLLHDIVEQDTKVLKMSNAEMIADISREYKLRVIPKLDQNLGDIAVRFLEIAGQKISGGNADDAISALNVLRRYMCVAGLCESCGDVLRQMDLLLVNLVVFSKQRTLSRLSKIDRSR